MLIRKIVAISIICSLYLAIGATAPVSAKSAAEKQRRFTEKLKPGISKLGVGPAARVEVKLLDKTKLSGYISEVNDDSFVVTDSHGTSTVVAYPNVSQVKGNNLSTGKKFAIAAVIVGALAIIYFAVFAGKHL